MTNKDHLIYCFLDENQKPFYIGQTYDLKMRMRAHNQFMVDVEERRPQSKYAYYQKAREILKTGKNVKVKIRQQVLIVE